MKPQPIMLALGAILMATPALAQQKSGADNRAIDDAGGRVISRPTTDTSGQTTVYSADGRLHDRY